jgi:magnesium chelatase subunit H
MLTMTFISGMERFNAHIWETVQQRLRDEQVAMRVLRFHDGHVASHDPQLSTALQSSDVLFISLINMREQADWLAEQIAATQAKAVFAFESMPEVMALNRVGEYRVSPGKGSIPKPMQAILKLITRGRDEDTLYAYTKLTKATVKLLPLMPAKLRDFRTWLSANIYWNQPDAFNLTQLIKLIARDCLGQNVNPAPPRLIPTMGCFHPDANDLFDNPEAFIKWEQRRAPQRKKQPFVALLAFRKHVIQEQQYLVDLVRALEQAEVRVLPIFVSGIETHVAVREWLTRQPIDLLLSTMGFPLVGGPAGSTNPGKHRDKASDLLASLDVPYIIAQPLQMQPEEQWREQGVAPMQAVIMYDLPEMDGSIAPLVLGAIRGQMIVAAPDRLARLTSQIRHWLRLRHKPRTDRRVAFVLYNYPPGLGRLATAALLDVPASLHATLQHLDRAGYRVEGLPATAAQLAEQLATLEQTDQQTNRMSVSAYRHALAPRHADRIEHKWGAAPGDLAPLGRDAIRIDGLPFGNIFVGVQPPMGVPGDPMRMLFDREYVPHHQYVAFYRWLETVWQADAIVHVGMHGTAEWMPGLQLGLTGDCWPDVLLGNVPHFYLYPLNNPAEATIAKRRGAATIVSHLVPPYARAGLYKQLAQLRATIADPALPCDEIPDLPRHTDDTDQTYRQRLSAYLDELEQRLILDGLHVFGRAPEPNQTHALLEASLDQPRNGHAGLSQALAASGVAQPELAAARTTFVQELVKQHPPSQRALHDFALEGQALLNGLAAAPGELNALLHVLDGGYLRPAVGADPIRAGAGALPSGRNIHSIDPWRLPSEVALLRGEAMATALIERHRAEHGGAFPQTIALTLWALDTIKSEGESLAVALALVGARPERDGQGKIWRYALTPLAELGRPRIDLLLDISPIFRDTFQMALDMLDQLFRQAAAADEPLTHNPIRAHALELQASGQSWEQATARIFTQAPGKYGTGVDELVDESQWDDTTQLAETYVKRGAHAYGGQRQGQTAEVSLRHMLGTVEHVFQAIDSVEFGLTDMQHYYGHSGAVQLAASQARGSAVALSYADTAAAALTQQGVPPLRSATQLIQIEARSKLLNPRWFEGMLNHGYAGAAEIGNRFTYLLGWSATTGAVDAWIYNDMAQTFVLDESMRQRLSAANPAAARNAVARLLEANGRGLWQADEHILEQLQTIYADLEDRLEGAYA